MDAFLHFCALHDFKNKKSRTNSAYSKDKDAWTRRIEFTNEIFENVEKYLISKKYDRRNNDEEKNYG